MAFDKDAGVNAGNADLSVARDAWVKPEILSFEPVSAAQAVGVSGPFDGNINQS
jgi:hypothetical protein